MAANSSVVLTSLDFDSLKQNFKTYLATQSVFKDYDYNGSNINVLLDVMAYNSYLNSFYLNMVASEMFMDSAQKYDSVVSHAKELNYTPRSARSSVADITLTLTADSSGQIQIPKGTRFSGTNSNGIFTFTTNELSSHISVSNSYTVSNLMIYEGKYFTDSYVVNYNIESQKFLLTNKNVDVDSLEVTVYENNGANTTIFARAQNLYGLNDTSSVYFLQAAQNNLYEVVFGDGLFGRVPLNGATVSVNYRVSSGIVTDGITSFTLVDDLSNSNPKTIRPSTIVVNSSSAGGANQESIESVKFSAPRYFATQQRAVASDDYSSLVLNNFGGVISDVNVYGGETIEPKKYGRVIIVVKPANGTIAPDYIKSQIASYLKDFIALPNRVEIVDPDYLYVSVISYVQYDPKQTTKSISEIQAAVLNSITNYSMNNLEYFGNDLRFSRLSTDIDNADSSITSNQTDLRAVKRLSPKLNYATSYKLDMNNVIYYEGGTLDTGIPHTELYISNFDTHVEHASVISDKFTWVDSAGTEYPLSYIADDGAGNIKIYSTVQLNIQAIANIGSVDYTNGLIQINNLTTSYYPNYINLYVRTRDSDIYAKNDKIILIDPTDVSIIVTETRR
jgi:hypothetical protein